MSKRGPKRERAQRTTPAPPHFVEVDDGRTFLVFGAFTESMLGLTLGEAPRPLVRADLTGKWNHGADDQPVLMLAPGTARDWAKSLTEAAEAAERDLVTYLSGAHPDDGSPR